MVTSSKRKELTNFYIDELKFSIIQEFSSGVMIDLGSAILEIFDPREDRSYPDKFSLSLMVANVAELWNELKSNVNIAHELRHNNWGDSSFGIVDPEGNNLVFFSPDNLI